MGTLFVFTKNSKQVSIQFLKNTYSYSIFFSSSELFFSVYTLTASEM